MSNTKGNKKVIIITLCIVAALTVALTLFLVFIDAIVANVKMSQFKKNISDCETVVISSPTYFDGINSGAEVVVTDERAETLTDKFLGIADGINFDKIVGSSEGIWDITLTFYFDDAKYTAHLEENGISITDGNGYRFDINKDSKYDYEDFYHEINQILKDSKA